MPKTIGNKKTFSALFGSILKSIFLSSDWFCLITSQLCPPRPRTYPELYLGYHKVQKLNPLAGIPLIKVHGVMGQGPTWRFTRKKSPTVPGSTHAGLYLGCHKVQNLVPGQVLPPPPSPGSGGAGDSIDSCIIHWKITFTEKLLSWIILEMWAVNNAEHWTAPLLDLCSTPLLSCNNSNRACADDYRILCNHQVWNALEVEPFQLV